jgi:hypothetical protein
VSCDRCEKLCAKIEIRAPQDLRRSIALARDGIAAGAILDVSGQFPFPSSPFTELASGGPWDDHVNYYFQCAHCRQLFHLEAETYHGSGGSWSALDGLPAAAL